MSYPIGDYGRVNTLHVTFLIITRNTLNEFKILCSVDLGFPWLKSVRSFNCCRRLIRRASLVNILSTIESRARKLDALSLKDTGCLVSLFSDEEKAAPMDIAEVLIALPLFSTQYVHAFCMLFSIRDEISFLFPFF